MNIYIFPRGERVLIKGNEAIAQGAIDAGCRHFFGYPITPQNEIPEYMALHLPAVGGCFLQAESEVAAINMVYGAAAAGKRVMTTSSSPGISLMQEGISYIVGAELPAVLVNVVASLILVPVAIFVFKDKLNWVNIVGILVCLVGLVMLNWKR